MKRGENMARIVLISGKAESGKDTIANLIMQGATEYGVYLNLHIADAVKKIAVENFGWNLKKDTKGRELLQLIGDGGRHYNPDIWVDKFIKELEKSIKEYATIDEVPLTILVPDTRYKNEVIKILAWGDRTGNEVLTLRVERPNYENKLTQEQRENSSETDLDNWGIWDFSIVNDSDIDALKNVVNNVLYILEGK